MPRSIIAREKKRKGQERPNKYIETEPYMMTIDTEEYDLPCNGGGGSNS